MENENMLPFVDLKKVLPLIKKAWDFQAKGYGTTFIDLSGHVGTLDIKLYVHGWSGIKSESFHCEIRLSEVEKTKWMRFDVDRINDAMNEIDALIENLPTEEELRKKNVAIKLENDRKQYEILKARFDSPS